MGKDKRDDQELRLTLDQVKEAYAVARRDFKTDVHRAIQVSRGVGGLAAETDQHFWASILFTRMIVTSLSMLNLSPLLGDLGHWDLSSIASIARNLSECYLFFFFLCVDDVPEVEKAARIILLNLHDHASRRKLKADGNEMARASSTSSNDHVHEDLIRKFHANEFLSGLPRQRQKELIKGSKTPFSREEVISRANVDKEGFQFLYWFFSIHTHSNPVSFYRMAEQGRGNGVENRYDIFYISVILGFAGDLLRRATSSVLLLFPEAEARGRACELILTPETNPVRAELVRGNI